MLQQSVRRMTCWVLVVIGAFSAEALAQGDAGQSQAEYKVKKQYNVQIPMRDGVKLSADVYRPEADGKFPVILCRTPYSNDSKAQFDFGMYFASHGYVYMAEDSRGRLDSGGTFLPLFDEGRDGYDTIEWAAGQPWSTGKVGTIGGSYAGWNQWLAAVEGNDHLKTMISIVTPPDPFLNVPYQNGAFLLGMADWMILIDGRSIQDLSSYDLVSLYRHLPVRTMDEAAGRHANWWREWTDHNSYDEYWKKVSYQDKFERVKVPVLHVTGWYDDDQVGALVNYPGMLARGGSPEARSGQKLLIGPWPHRVNAGRKLGDIDFGPDATIDINGVYLRWFDCQLKAIGCRQLMNEAPVRLFIMGDNRWRDESEWPLSRAQVKSFYFTSQGKANSFMGDGGLTEAKPGNDPPDHFTYDPANPVPFILVPGALQLGTTEDQRAVESRQDVLVYTSAVLEQAIEVTGPVRVKLWAASSAPDTDWTGKLIDVHPNGYAQRLLDGIMRARFRESYERPSVLQSNQVYEYTIDLWATSNVFQKDHRIRLEISSSSFPKYTRNLNTGENNETSTAMRIAQQTIYHDAAHPSHVLLPIIPRPR